MWRAHVGLMVMVGLCVGTGVAQAQPCDLHWSDDFPFGDLDGDVLALVVFDDGSGPALYAGGWFTTAGDRVVNHIAKWDGTSWWPLGSGMNSSVEALTVYNGELIAGGQFSTAGGYGANRIAKWDGSSWSALGTGMNSAVRALTVFDDGSGPALYAGGSFSTAGGTPIASPNGTAPPGRRWATG